MSTSFDSLPPIVQKTERFGVHIDVALHPTSEHELWTDMTFDAANGGVLVATYHALPVGTPVTLFLTIGNDPKEVEVAGVVRWTRGAPPGLGIALVDPPEEVTNRLQAFAEVRPPMFYDDGRISVA